MKRKKRIKKNKYIRLENTDLIIIIIIIKDKYQDLARELKKTMEREGDIYTHRDWCFWYSS